MTLDDAKTIVYAMLADVLSAEFHVMPISDDETRDATGQQLDGVALVRRAFRVIVRELRQKGAGAAETAARFGFKLEDFAP
jgi:hypothetical protein